jgi:hypothetical protein
MSFNPARVSQSVKNKCTTTLFKASLSITHGNGKYILFWHDPWLHGVSLEDRWPDLAMAIPMQRRRKLTLEASLLNGVWIRDISSTLMVPIILHYLDAQ